MNIGKWNEITYVNILFIFMAIKSNHNKYITIIIVITYIDFYFVFTKNPLKKKIIIIRLIY